MAAPHIGVNDTTYYGRLLRNVLTNMQLGTDGLSTLLGTMALMIDGDGTQDAHYTLMQTDFGWATTTVAHNAYLELTALQNKLITDASVTLIKTQLAQCYNKFR